MESASAARCGCEKIMMIEVGRQDQIPFSTMELTMVKEDQLEEKYVEGLVFL